MHCKIEGGCLSGEVVEVVVKLGTQGRPRRYPLSTPRPEALSNEIGFLYDLDARRTAPMSCETCGWSVHGGQIRHPTRFRGFIFEAIAIVLQLGC
jgi:hypothetical protein